MKLWAITSCNGHKIRIYVNSKLEDVTWAYTNSSPKGVFIVLHGNLLKQSGQLIDEILIHEFVHVAEYLYPKQLAKPNPDDCTQYARVIQKTMPQLLRNLKQTTLKRSAVRSKGR